MKLNRIFNKLDFSDAVWLSNYNSETQIYFARKMISCDSLDKNTLYICMENDLSRNMDIHGLSFLCICGDIGKSEGCKFHNANLIALSSNVTADVVLETVERILTDYITLIENKDRIIRLLNRRNTLQDIIDEAYKVLGNPIFVVNNAYRIIAKSPDVENIRPDIREQTVIGYISEKNINDLKNARIHENARLRQYPVYTVNPNDGQGWITSMITSHGIEVAHLAGADINKPFSDADIDFIEFICNIIANQLGYEEAKFLSHENLDSILLTDLIRHTVRDEATVVRRCRSLSWSFDDYLHILTVHSGNEDITRRKLIISNSIKSIFPNAKWAVIDGRLVFLIAAKVPHYEIFTSNIALSEFLKINNLKVSLCRAFTNYSDTMRFYNESMAAYYIGERVNPGKNIHIYTDYLFQHIAGILSESQNISNFFHPAIPKIVEYDRAHGTSLLETLKVHLLYPDNPAMAAGKLFVHKNTLFNRINKLKEKFNLDFSNGDELLSLGISLKFMEMEKKT